MARHGRRGAGRGARNDGDGGERNGGDRRGGLRLPLLVNLGLGLVATVPLGLAWWLATEWLPMDCRTVPDLATAANCDYTVLDHAPVVMVLLAVTGVPTAIAALVANVVLPLRRRRRLAPWLCTAAVLLPMPSAALLALALTRR